MFRSDTWNYLFGSKEKHLSDTGAFSIENLLVERKAIKHLYLRIEQPSGRVRVSAPKRMSDADIARFLQSKRQWIARKRSQLQQKSQLVNPDISATEVLLWGQHYPLVLQPYSGRAKVLFDQEKIVVLGGASSRPEQLQTLLDNWLRQQLQQRLQERVPYWEAVSGTRANEVRIKRMKTRWGTCNIRAARIWVNAELVKLPPACLDYIILHELVHLLERLHNRRFHALVEQFMPDWRSTDTLLNRYLLPR
ncbi:M48 family metallopeptidase [Nitrincola iocasae]|jgi:predicted metal-dependent hydrolase|uniref:M48 family metallopeptidase n=1 Tax=Nitrincola iocasae TaxID=2614693 RepID=A0A5J6LDP0_9GAMM|nr:SprT family zinc-dependent metalloprotease [Nitrincola iocasae]QEW06725.1 M48 family metallopeptidase [Nitrincola iocasae]